MSWTPELDALLAKTIRADGGRYADAARAIARATHGRFTPHASTCLRRLREVGKLERGGRLRAPMWKPWEVRKLVALHRAGASRSNIADALGRREHQIESIITRLIREGAIVDSRRKKPGDARESTRVDAMAPAIPPRVRPPIGERLAPPNVNVISVPLALVERLSDGGDAFVSDLLSSIPPGWSFAWADVDETRSDAIACSRHQAALRGDRFDVLENEPGRPAIVSIGKRGSVARPFVLVVVRYSRTTSRLDISGARAYT